MSVLVLNSAHGKYPVGSEGWVQATARAVRALRDRGEKLVCSTEPLQWDLVTWLAGKCGAEILLVVKAPEADHGRDEYSRLLADFALDPRRTSPLFLPGNPVCSAAHPKDAWPVRDRFALDFADAVYPVSIRPGGRLEAMIREAPFRGKLRQDFRIPWTPPGYIPRYTLAGRPWNPLPSGEWLVHWTRTCQGKWPGEPSHEFFRDLFARGYGYVRSAPDTLRRILGEGRVRGSAWKMPGNIPAVAFTALSPGDAVALMQWRKRYARYTFEPWGIAVRREALSALGAGEVAYTGNQSDQLALDGFFTHAAGEEDRWVREREWRLRGDLLLAEIPPEAARVIGPDHSAAR
jgi:hypothetical protein